MIMVYTAREQLEFDPFEELLNEIKIKIFIYQKII